MTTIRFEIEKFNSITNFNLWQVRMIEILVQTDMKKNCYQEKARESKSNRMERT
ncbi:hypothetical protein Goklo_027008 [Gossypium klotzschianum]|uniref:Uncharacterized protein n=1 Tax=Gossypium klotzschianum TaxID=34286 RepID=A0A7J8TWR4_9ROSI|nr:hypothetical protein [Gossypium klotzschianum]